MLQKSKYRGKLLPLGLLFLFFYRFFSLVKEFLSFLSGYLKKKIVTFSQHFEKQKNLLVRFFMMKRGRYNRPFLHSVTISVLGIGVIVAPFIAESNPIFTKDTANALAIDTQLQTQSVTLDSDVFQTQVSKKPRDKVIIYTVENGDTISTIAKKFGISSDTIRWANDLSGDTITVGDELKIPPVTGIVHKVAKGETVYTIAKKYTSNPQAIVDFPFNDFANPQTFSLVEGQMLVVPDGVKPSEKQNYVNTLHYIATGPSYVGPSGWAWPLSGTLNQYYSWYHPGIDIGAPVGTPILAAENGSVSEVYTGGWNGGYGVHVIVSGPDGTTTLYAHMSGVNVSAGQTVTAGSTVLGWVGLTGRTTGPHLHLEVRNGGNVNPLSYLPQ